MGEREVAYGQPADDWNGEQIKALRQHMGLTQQEMANELAVRQQTISEWEKGLHHPHRSTRRMLKMIAEQHGFQYGEPADGTGEA